MLRDEKEAEEIEKKKMYEAVDKISSLKAEIAKLRDEVQKKKDELEQRNHDNEILSNLYELGIIDEEGKLLHQRYNKMN